MPAIPHIRRAACRERGRRRPSASGTSGRGTSSSCRRPVVGDEVARRAPRPRLEHRLAPDDRADDAREVAIDRRLVAGDVEDEMVGARSARTIFAEIDDSGDAAHQSTVSATTNKDFPDVPATTWSDLRTRKPHWVTMGTTSFISKKLK